MPVLKPEALIDERVAALRKAHRDANIPRAELDLSGGIDSAVMAGLLVLALGPESVTLVHSRFATSHKQTDRARSLAAALTCPLVDAGLGGVWEVLMTEMREALKRADFDLAEIDARLQKDPTILGSIRSCLRAPIGRGFNRLTGGGLRHGTGNEDEDRFLRFYQKGGDGEVDSNPIAMLSKGEVYQLALALSKRLPATQEAFLATIEAAPSPDLWGTGDGHTDEAELRSWLGVPFTYSRIDPTTGQYKSVGTIERVSRFLDLRLLNILGGFKPDMTVADIVFSSTGVNLVFSSTGVNLLQLLASYACTHPLFFGQPFSPEALNVRVGGVYTLDQIKAFLMAARKAEAQTRHKLNPNIPMYGSRRELVEAGILTDELPALPAVA